MKYSFLISEVVNGLDQVLDNGVLPDNYRGVFHQIVSLCDEITREIETPLGASGHSSSSDALVWFRDLEKRHPEAFNTLAASEVSLDDVVGVLRHLSRDDSLSPYAYQVELILAIQSFFLELRNATQGDRESEWVVGEIIPAFFIETSTRLQ